MLRLDAWPPPGGQGALLGCPLRVPPILARSSIQQSTPRLLMRGGMGMHQKAGAHCCAPLHLPIPSEGISSEAGRRPALPAIATALPKVLPLSE
jgi:hypothetical protein